MVTDRTYLVLIDVLAAQNAPYSASHHLLLNLGHDEAQTLGTASSRQQRGAATGVVSDEVNTRSHQTCAVGDV